MLFSPHARGCSPDQHPQSDGKNVFPACAGMFLTASTRPLANASFPRMRGDVPFPPGVVQVIRVFSPHARGCSQVIYHPAESLSRFPRMRGDVPEIRAASIVRMMFSPHARGCSWQHRQFYYPEYVFPACAGMFRYRKREKIFEGCFPRMRGDVPSAFRSR